MNDTFLIGLAGRKGSGKSTVGAALLESIVATRDDLSVVKMAFADPLRDMLVVLMVHDGMDEGVARSLMYSGELKEIPVRALGMRTQRHALQTLGTEWGRDLMSPTLWSDIAKNRILKYKAEGVSVIIDDVRFDTEVGLLHSLGGRTFRLLRDDDSATDTHVSERGIDFYDRLVTEVYNNGSLQNTVGTIMAAMGDLIPE